MSTPCPGRCGAEIPVEDICCADCLRRLHESTDLVLFAEHAVDISQEMYDFARHCVEMWFRVNSRRTVEVS